jgi:ParB-like chromosome segregation protein Spo0J
MTWISDLAWRGPVQLPLARIDYSRSRFWSAAKDPRKVASFAARMRQGWRKPVVMVQTPSGRLKPVDGHTRLLAARVNGTPVDAWVGLAKSEHGTWDSAHDQQKG